jgi:hypothetical protein
MLSTPPPTSVVDCVTDNAQDSMDTQTHEAANILLSLQQVWEFYFQKKLILINEKSRFLIMISKFMYFRPILSKVADKKAAV